MIPLSYYLVLSSLLFAVGLWGALARANAIRVLMGIEIMLNAASLNFIAFNRHLLAAGTAPADPTAVAGQVFSVFVITIAAAEAAIGLAIILLIARRRGIVDVNQVSSMRG